VSKALLETLLDEQRALIAALDADDVDAIARHSAGVGDAVAGVRAHPERFSGPEAKALAEEALALADTARARVNVLADLTSRRLTRLAVATGKGNAAPTYGRNGRLGQ